MIPRVVVTPTVVRVVVGGGGLSGPPVDLGPITARLDTLQAEIGDPSLLDHGAPEHDLVHWLMEVDSRLAALEGGGSAPPLPVPEGALEVDMYGGSFVRVRDTANLLADGGIHPVTFALATVAGPGGAVIDPVAGVPAGTAGTWFDSGGTLGGIVGTTGSAVSQTTLRNWVKYGNPASGSYYLVWVNIDRTTDPERPRLVVDRVANLS